MWWTSFPLIPVVLSVYLSDISYVSVDLGSGIPGEQCDSNSTRVSGHGENGTEERVGKGMPTFAIALTILIPVSLAFQFHILLNAYYFTLSLMIVNLAHTSLSLLPLYPSKARR